MLATGDAIIQFQHHRSPFGDPESREPIRQMLNTIADIDIPADRLGGRPTVPLAAIADERKRREFLAVFDFLLDQTRKAEQ